MKKGLFMDGSITGVHYESSHYSGELDSCGQYNYEEGDSLTFSLGSIALGSCIAKPLINTLDFIPESYRQKPDVTNYTAVNMARLLLSIKNFSAERNAIISKLGARIQFCSMPESFEQCVQESCEEIGVVLISVARTHNILRRCVKGILKETDVKIPVSGGRHVLGDIYRPLQPGKYPVIISMGAFGKSFIIGFTRNEEDEQYFESVEDQFYENYGSPDTKMQLLETFFRKLGKCVAWPVPNTDGEVPEQQLPLNIIPVSSAFEQVTADDWVPYGYVVMNVEEYGTGRNNDHEYQFGARNAKDYCDVITWAADQPWSTGKVGLYGASYYAMTQYLAAQRHPRGLTAMIPIMGDYDSYRHYVYSGGGLFNVADNSDLSEPTQEYCFMHKVLEEPFWNEETYGTEADYVSSADITKIDYPIWTVLEPDASLHGLGTSEAYINCASKNKKLTLINGAAIHFWMYNEQYLSRHRAFFDYWLKGEKNAIMEEKPVEIQIRTGNGSFYWRREEDWPVPNTKYEKLYLDATNGGLSANIPDTSGKVTYSADVKRSLLHRVAGATFTTAAFEEDVALAGYIKAGLYISSTTTDMELHIQVRVLDENGEEVIFPGHSSLEKRLPLGFGSLKVSHRMMDEEKSRDDHPVYVHTKEAYAPLVPNEVVYCEVAMFPTSGFVKRGWRIQVDIDPISNRWIDYNEGDYRKGSENTIYSGMKYASYLQIPVLPESWE